MKRKIYLVLCVAFFMMGGIFVFKIGSNVVTGRQEEEAFRELSQMVVKTETVSQETNDNYERFASLYETNSDFVGWLTIEDTNIDYPVMYTEKDSEYYLHRDFYENDSFSGTPFIGKGCTKDGDNTIIYAHCMKNGTMFHDLLKYADYDFYQEHQEMKFDTLQEEGSYEIVATFYEQIQDKEVEDAFRYYNYVGNLSEAQYEAFVETIKDKSLYDTGITPTYGEKLITLSTCSYHVNQGRFVVVAVKTH